MTPHPEHPDMEQVGRRLNREWGAAMGYDVADTVAWCRTLCASDTEALLMADRLGHAVGVAAMLDCDLPARSQYAPWLSSLLVWEEARDRGIGTALVFAAVEVARRNGRNAIYLYARAGRLVRFYEDLGFDRVERLTIDGDGFWIMRRSTGIVV